METTLLEVVSRAIGDRNLVWFGIRGQDGLPLVVHEQLRSCHSITGPVPLDGVAGLCLEDLTGRRVDLDLYDLDADTAPEVLELRRSLLAELNQPSVIVGYRPSRFLSALHFARLDSVTMATMFHEQQLPFEHKPWVETHVAALGVRTVPWQYVADEQHADVHRALHEGPLMLRPSRGSGGVGMARVDDEDSLGSCWPRQLESFVSVAPFLEDVLPVNVSACAVPNGDPAVHAASVQLIGHPACIDRPFGYCGNDYAAAKELRVTVLDELEGMTSTVGRWLGERGFVGAFGVDYLVRDDEVFFTELNPRFQGGSTLSADVDAASGLPDIYTEHLGAHLGVCLPCRPPMREQVALAPPLAHVVTHNRSGAAVRRRSPLTPDLLPSGLVDLTLVPRPGVEVSPGGVVFRLVLAGPVTATGFDLDQRTTDACGRMDACFA